MPGPTLPPQIVPQDSTGVPTTPPEQSGTTPAAPPPTGSLVRDPTAHDRMSPAEYQEEMKRQLEQARQNDLPDQETGNPLSVAWQHMKYRIPRLPDAAVRGVANFLNQGADLVESAAVGSVTGNVSGSENPTSIADVTGHGDFAQQVRDAGGSLAYVRQQNEKSGATAAFNQALDKVVGPASEDPVLKTSTAIAQFATGFAMTGPLGDATEAGWLGKIGINALRGGVTEAAFFDPKEASLMNTLAGTNIPGLKEMGKALSIHPDDPEIVARFKHLANGGILTAAGEAALLSGAKLLGYARQIAKARANGASEAEIAPVIAKAQAEQKTVTQVGNGTYSSPDDVIKVTPNPDGTGTIEPHRPASPPTAERPTVEAPQIGGRPTMAAHNTADQIEQIAEKNGVTVQVSRKGGDVVQIDRIEVPEADRGTGKMGKTLEEIHAVADQNGTTLQQHIAPDMPEGMTEQENRDAQASMRDMMRKNGGYEQPNAGKSFMVREPGAQPNSFRETAQPSLPEEQIPVADAAKAAPEVDAFNNAAKAHIDADSPVTAENVDEYKTIAQRMSLATSDEDMARLVQTMRFNNVNYASEPTQVLAHAAALESAFKEEFAKNGETWAQTAAKAAKMLPASDEPLSPALAKGLSAPDLAARTMALDAMRWQQTQDITKLSQMLDANPTSDILMDNMRTGLDNYMETSRIVAGHDSEVGRALNVMKNRGALKESMAAAREDIQSGGTKGAPDAAVQESQMPPGEAAVQKKGYTDGMTNEEVAALGRMVRATDGDLRDAGGIAEAATQIQNTFRERVGEQLAGAQGLRAKSGVMMSAALNTIRESFINYLFGNPKTDAVVVASGIMNSMFDDISRWGAGLVTGNTALRQQGADQMYALFKEQAGSVESFKQSFVEGRSTLNPQPDKFIIGGVTGKVLRLPTRALSAAHEYLLANNYRSFVRADALAAGREAGLDGMDLETRVQQDLAASFDKNTGIALRQDAWDYAMDQTFQSPLRPGSFPRAIQDYANSNPNARWIIPVWKLGVNMFDKMWQWTPGLNQFNKGARATLDAGGPEASVLHAKSAIAASVYTATYLMAQAGNLTGDGPKDPDIRAMWLKNNQPNSFRFGSNGDWLDYSRMEPWATAVGTVANFHELTSEWGDKKSDANHSMAFAIPAALVANLANKSYYEGLSRISDMITSGDPQKYASFMRRTAAAATPIPLHGTMNAMNPDPYFREVRSMMDAEKASLPGFSETLDPKFNVFGEPTLKNPSYVQRTFFPFFKGQKNSSSVEDDMVSLNARLKPWAEQFSIPGVQSTLDLTDKKSWAEGAADPKKSPWIRFNELLRTPEDGSDSFRSQLENYVHGDDYQFDAGRTPGFTGSAREDKVKQLKVQAEQTAWRSVLEEYPALRDSVSSLQRLAAAAKRAGPQGVADAKQ